MLKKILTATMALFVTAQASVAEGLMPDRAYIPLLSHHAGIDPSCCNRTDWNTVNLGVILSWQNRFGGLNYSAGIFKNSYDDYSPIFSISKTFYEKKDVAISGFLATANYYENAKFITNRNSPWVFIPGVQVSYRDYYVQAVPVPNDGKLGAIFSFGLTFPFK